MSTGELLLTATIALLVLGPNQLPIVARKLGQLMKQVHDYKQHLSVFLDAQSQAHQLQDNLKKAAEADEHYK